MRKGVSMFIPFSLRKFFSRKPQKRIPGNMQKRIGQRFFRIPKGYTIAGPNTQEFKRIIAASKGADMSRKPAYGSKAHLKWLKRIIVVSKKAQLKAQGGYRIA